MKYAIISDMHGNIHAFSTVLADAKAQGVDKFLLLGDYASSFPYGNDVVNTMRDLDACFAIRGNGEDYLIDLMGCNPDALTNEQFKPIYWSYRSLSAENLIYLANLPISTKITDSSADIHLTHHMDIYFRQPKIPLFHSELLRQIRKTTPITHDTYLAQAKNALLSDPNTLAEMNAMPKGIYLSGHNHLQFHMFYEDKLFINPGSCGEPLDWNTKASYTILTVTETAWTVDERRVRYDLDAASEGLVASGFANYAPMWAKIMELELHSAQDYFMPFVMHLVATGKEMGSTSYPVNETVWQRAVATFNPANI